MLREIIMSNFLNRFSNQDGQGVAEAAESWYNKGVLTEQDMEIITNQLNALPQQNDPARNPGEESEIIED